MPAKRSNLVKPFLQVAFLSLGLLCALSRIFDYWHHWGDVLVGMFLGAIVAFFIVSFWSDILRMDHYFFEVGVGQFPKKLIRNKNCWKKFMQGEPWWKNWASAFYYPGTVLCDVKKLLHNLFPPKNIIHNQKVRKKISCPKKLPWTLLPQKNNSLSLRVMLHVLFNLLHTCCNGGSKKNPYHLNGGFVENCKKKGGRGFKAKVFMKMN